MELNPSLVSILDPRDLVRNLPRFVFLCLTERTTNYSTTQKSK